MAGSTETSHPTAREIADYLSGSLPQVREAELDRHFGECDTCPDVATRMRMGSALLARWSARDYGIRFREARVLAALNRTRAAQECAPWHERISRWLGHLAGRADIAARIVIEQVEGTCRARVRSAVEFVGADTIWSDPLPDAPLVVRSGRDPEAAVLITQRGGGGRALIAVSADGKWVEVSIDRPSENAVPPLVLLVPDDPVGRLLAAELRPSDDGNRLAVVFSGVGPGRYVVAMEPTDRGEAQ